MHPLLFSRLALPFRIYSGDLIKTMFLKLEELFVQAIITGPAYTNSQLVDRALGNVKQTGLYMSAVQDLNALPQ